MTPIELKKLRSTKKDPQSYFAYMPPFRAEGNAVLDRNGYFVAQYSDTVIFMANGKAYNIAEVIAEGVNRLVESVVSKNKKDGVIDLAAAFCGIGDLPSAELTKISGD